METWEIVFRVLGHTGQLVLLWVLVTSMFSKNKN